MIEFSAIRWWSIVCKEFIQLIRDKPTFAMVFGVPILQLLLFGFAINTDPKHLPTALISANNSFLVRSFITGMQNTDYFKFDEKTYDENSAEKAIAVGDVLFVVNIPPDFTRSVLRGESPSILVEADASDPTAVGNALAAINYMIPSIALHDFKGVLSLPPLMPPYQILIHKRYNPEGITQYNIVPGLIGVILTMTMIMMTGMSITKEYERGTMENLLAMPVSPLEVMSGKIIPYIMIGLMQVTTILLSAKFIFGIPCLGSVFLLYFVTLLFISGNLTIGIAISSKARNQLQAMQMTTFFFLPSMILGGFLFPFKGMPEWAQFLGNLFPMTYFLRVVRGILLKGNGWYELWPNIWPLMACIVVVMIIGLKFYRKTLD